MCKVINIAVRNNYIPHHHLLSFSEVFHMNPVVHFELPAEDRARMVEFYEKAFGWKAQMYGEDMQNYTVVTTTPSDESGRPTTPGAINGGLYVKNPEWPAQYPSIVIGVKDIREAMEKVIGAGGTVLGEPMDIPNVGSYVSFMDTEGNRISILQPKM
jgi:uncharacterized protein